ncbi:Uncharacterized protein TCM_040940 [Theobroma cacao]|uniref:Uncharacterized protein n=1 Tax=Theobroma cacao TaxID=3641 RepID=A0A061GTS6_THECC|nr:Uncharacterized protein TCM_040940 [Theobroma cacao]
MMGPGKRRAKTLVLGVLLLDGKSDGSIHWAADHNVVFAPTDALPFFVQVLLKATNSAFFYFLLFPLVFASY